MKILEYLLVLVGCTTATAAVPVENYMTVYQSKHGPLTSVIVDSMERVIVAGRNVLLQFSDGNVCPDTTLQNVQESNCMTSSCNISSNNDVLILKALPTSNNLSILFCGTENNGQCFLLDKENITNYIEIAKLPDLSTNISGAYLRGRSSARAIPIPMSKITNESNFEIFFGIDTSSSYVFSQRILSRYEGAYDMYYFERGSMVYIKAKAGYKVELVHGFHDENHVYFLWNLQTPNGINSARLSQMCVADMSFMSYIESEISCGQYSIVTSALTNSFKNAINENKTYLFATFSSSRHHGSALCIYDVSDNTAKIPTYFYETLSDCFRKAMGSRPEWIVGDETSCTQLKPDASLACTGNKHINGRILSHRMLKEPPVIVNMDKDMTSVVVATIAGKHIVYIGYDDGSLSKEIIEIGMLESTFLYNIPIPDATSIRRNMALAGSGNKLLFTYDDKVAMLRVDQCGLHTSCLGCLSDVSRCAWYASSSYQAGECYSIDAITGLDVKKIYRYQICPIVLTSVMPTMGPTAGGTRITLTGDFGTGRLVDIYFNTDGTGDKRSDSSRLKIDQHNSTRIVCVTPAVEEPMAHTIYMEIKKDSYLPTVHVEGTIQFSNTFQFLVPTVKLNELPPRSVKISGDVQVRFTGTNLAVGDRTHVQVGNQTCTITASDTHSNTEVSCRAPAQAYPGTYNTTIHIDGAVLSGPGVIYVDEPILQTVSPQKSIRSGGLVLTIHGERLEGFGQALYLTYTDDYGAVLNYSKPGNCHVNSSTVLVCETPNISTNHALPRDVTLTFSNMYGAINTSVVIVTLVPDPIVRSFAETIYLEPEERRINIKGDNLTNVDKKDIRVSVGVYACLITQLRQKNIQCKLERVPNPVDKLAGTVLVAYVQVGNHPPQQVGHVVFKKPVVSPAPVVDLENSHTGFIVAGIIVACIAVVVAGCFATKRLLASNMCRKAEEHYNVAFRPGRDIPTLDGLSENNTTDVSQNRQNAYHEQTFLKSTPENSVDKESTPLLPVIDEETRAVLIRQHLLIDPGSFVLGEVIGQGHFGCVFKAYYQQAAEKQEKIVAGKTLHRTNPSDLDVQTFLKEALIMKDFHHRNVMELIGICLGMDTLPVVVLPYMQRGDLLTYLRDPNNVPTVKDLVLFSVDIANGMHYLSQLKFVHRDLAARNCMIADDLTVKVADFGLSRDVYEKQYYSSKDKTTKLPVKWMSPESLEFCVYSSKTDMWSYGVVLWELLTRGMFPYPGVDNWDILRFLTEGRRMDKPQYCPDEIYEIMQRCWCWEANDRPSFGQLTEEIPQLIDRLDRSTGTKHFNTEITYVNCNPAFQKMS